MNGERYYTTKIWERPSSIEFSSAGVLSTSMDPPGEPVISTWKRPCQKIQNGSEFPELVAQNSRNPHGSPKIWVELCKVLASAVTGEVESAKGTLLVIRLHVQVSATVSARVRFCSAIHEILLSSE